MFLVDDLPGLEESVVIPVREEVAFQAEHTAIGRMADVVDPSAAFDVAPADHHERLVSRHSEWWGAGGGSVGGRELRFPVIRQEWICEIDRRDYRPQEYAAGGDLRIGVVVVEAEFGVRANARREVEVGEGVECELVRRSAVIVVRVEVERIPATAIVSSIIGGVGDRFVEGAITRSRRPGQEKLACRGRSRASAGKSSRRRQGGPGLVVGTKGAGAEVAARLQDWIFLPVAEVGGRVAFVVGEVSAHQHAEAADPAVEVAVARYLKL